MFPIVQTPNEGNTGAGHPNPGTADGQVDNSEQGSTPAVSHSPGSGGTPLHCCGQLSCCPQGVKTAASIHVCVCRVVFLGLYSVLYCLWSRLLELNILASPGTCRVSPLILPYSLKKPF